MNTNFKFEDDGDKLFNVCSDVDEVVVNTAPKLCRLILEDNGLNHLWNTHITENDVLNRFEFDLDVWIPLFLLSKDIDLDIDFDGFALKAYKYHEDTFYDDLELSNFGKYIQSIAFKINNMIFVTHQGINDTNADSKTRFLEKHFGDMGNNGVLRVYPIPMNKRKSDILNQVSEEFNWDIYIDDRCSIMKDIVTGCITENKTLMLIKWNYTELEALYDPEQKRDIPLIAGIRMLKMVLDYSLIEMAVTELELTQSKIETRKVDLFKLA